MNVTMIGDGAHERTSEIGVLCAATGLSPHVLIGNDQPVAGGRYESIKQDDKGFIAESFKFYDTVTAKPRLHVQARVQV